MLLLVIYLTIETSFLIANLDKFRNGGWFTILFGTLFFIIMYGWYFGRKLKNRYLSFSKLDKYHQLFRDLSADSSIPNLATNLVYIIKANDTEQVESKVIHSIFSKQPKRAKTYWFLHIDRTDEPERFEYKVTHIIPGLLVRVDFMLGFKIEPKINLYFKEVLEDLVKSGEIKQESCFDCINKHSLPPDFRFILIDRVMPLDAELPFRKKMILRLHNISRLLALPETEVLQMDAANTFEERVPLTVNRLPEERISRIKKS
jgi:KUP system potassium uptake protein